MWEENGFVRQREKSLMTSKSRLVKSKCSFQDHLTDFGAPRHETVEGFGLGCVRILGLTFLPGRSLGGEAGFGVIQL